MSFYNPDQHTEPQQGLSPHRTFDELFTKFEAETKAKYSAFSVNKTTIRLWEEFKKEKGVGS